MSMDRASAARYLEELRKKMEPSAQERAAIELLIECAKSDTGQSGRCATFLLAWHNATHNGGFDLVDLWGMDDALADAMVTVFGFIRRSRYYPGSWGYKKDMERIWHLWRGPAWRKVIPPGAGNG